MVCSKTVEAREAQESLPARAASFRDPVGRVVFVGTRCFRVMTAQGANLLTEFLATMFERAARLTLELAMGVLPHAFRLKDGAPLYVMERRQEKRI